MNTAEAPIRSEVRDGVAHLILDRPAGLNALTLEMVCQLHAHLQAWEPDPAVRLIVLRGTGDKAFCAGGDVRALYESHRAGSDMHERFFRDEYALDQYIHRYPKPIVALMDGFTLGGGMGLAQGARLRLVTERSQLGMPETAIGFFPDVGASYFLPRLPGQLGLYLALTGTRVGAADALYCGLADGYLASDALAGLDETLAHLHETDGMARLFEHHLRRELPDPPLATLQPAIDEHFAAGDVASILQSLEGERHPPYRPWAQDTLALLHSRSPLALVVTHELQRRGAERDLAGCFEMEQHVGALWFEHGDIAEGVRAMLVDKDKKPRWRYQRLEQVTAEQVEHFFDGL
ncbi:enoyl-CoA hydratase/isomerase family protein [Stutzerimonas nosocomialis]|uniref:enoyl-CoA hydratase/isomerase family protein n=1 Tax=Stutzerimonas nosocomialis TaxID=1056496 RepID=UPI00110990FD|nr:enoyl-CoA hydratase/isomerase family protein [Stutzerimonas nosocomialis]TLX56034.1 enoyl-CoA hydratase/isomerase family protein [Stutzerimonas nosocomialis]